MPISAVYSRFLFTGETNLFDGLFCAFCYLRQNFSEISFYEIVQFAQQNQRKGFPVVSVRKFTDCTVIPQKSFYKWLPYTAYKHIVCKYYAVPKEYYMAYNIQNQNNPKKLKYQIMKNYRNTVEGRDLENAVKYMFHRVFDISNILWYNI